MLSTGLNYTSTRSYCEENPSIHPSTYKKDFSWKENDSNSPDFEEEKFQIARYL
jgi:hypothetical protein